MLAESSFYELELGPGEAVSLQRTPGWRIACIDGRVWVTEEGGGEDVWLLRGQSFMLSRPGRLVVEADGGATIRMSLRASRLRRTFAGTALAVARLCGGRAPAWPPLLPGRV